MLKGKRYKVKKNKNKRIIYIILILLIITSGFFICKNVFKRNIGQKNEVFIDNIKVQTTGKVDRRVSVKQLQKENPEVKGWINIDNTKIDYPLLQTNNNDYYMKYNYKKEYNVNGSIFVDKDYDWNLPSTNMLIYGHNNRGSDEMFASLLKYKDEEFYKNHKIIKITTPEEEREYEIIAVFLSRVYYKSEKNVFRYYFFINANNKKEFDEYVENSKKASLYDIETTANYGDELLTLSTCEWSQEDGRFAVVAKRIKK